MFINKNLILALSLFILVIPRYLAGQSEENLPQKVFRYCYAIQSKDWYQNQEKLWETEISKNPLNEIAWYSYYFACRYASTGMDGQERNRLLSSIADQVGKALPNSYLFPYIKYYNGDRKIEYLGKAYQLKPDCTDLYWEFIQYYDTYGNKERKKEFCEKLYSSKEIISSLYDYSYNVLDSAEPNSIILTNGDIDTYPLWILQESEFVRKDVMVLNAHALFVLRDYMKMKFNEKGINIDFTTLPREDEDIAFFLKKLISSIRAKYPKVSIYFVATMDYEYIKEIADKLFNTGLVYIYSEKQIDSITLIKKNLEQIFRLDYLEHDWYNKKHVSQTIMDGLNKNYISAFMELSKMYDSSGAIERAKYWRDKSVFLAGKADNKQ